MKHSVVNIESQNINKVMMETISEIKGFLDFLLL